MGSFAKLMRHYFEKDQPVKVVAFTADKQFCKVTLFDGLPLIPFEDIHLSYSKEKYYMFLAVGYSNMRARVIMYSKMMNKGFKTTNYVSNNACVDSDLVVGNNNIILQGTQIEPFCNVGNNNIFWSSVIISHDVAVGSNNFLASQSLIGGFTKIGDNCFLGFNSSVTSNIHLANETFLAAKSFLNEDSLPFSRYQGVPARLVSNHLNDGILVR